MKKKIILITLLFIISCNYKLAAQTDSSKIEFDLLLRERFESWNGMNAKNFGDPNGIGDLNDKMLLQRVIVGLNYKPNSKITVSAHLQDSRAFGWSLRNAKYPELYKLREDGSQTPYYIRNPNEEFFEIHDLFFEYTNLWNNISVKAGRQKIYFGDKRILALANGAIPAIGLGML